MNQDGVGALTRFQVWESDGGTVVKKDPLGPYVLWEDVHAEQCFARVSALKAALTRCVREIQPHHIPGDVYEQAQRALDDEYDLPPWLRRAAVLDAPQAREPAPQRHDTEN